MCFSATASFTLAGALVPTGIFTVMRTARSDSAWVPFAAFPLAFGLQQGIEGAVWLGLQNGYPDVVRIASRGFLFFSHFFWLAWVPLSVWRIETGPRRKWLLALLIVIGFAFGVSIFLPSFLLNDWLEVAVMNHSLDYRTTLIYDGYVDRTALRLFYAAIVVTALFLSTDWRIKVFGGLVTISLVATYGLFAYAFISVWCFFAAILSGYLVAVVYLDSKQARRAQASPVRLTE